MLKEIYLLILQLRQILLGRCPSLLGTGRCCGRCPGTFRGNWGLFRASRSDAAPQTAPGPATTIVLVVVNQKATMLLLNALLQSLAAFSLELLGTWFNLHGLEWSRKDKNVSREATIDCLGEYKQESHMVTNTQPQRCCVVLISYISILWGIIYILTDFTWFIWPFTCHALIKWTKFGLNGLNNKLWI